MLVNGKTFEKLDSKDDNTNNMRKFTLIISKYNVTENYMIGEYIESITCENSKKAIFLWLNCNYGKCTGKMYREVKNGKDIHIGYVFQKRELYDDTPEIYLAEYWIEL